MKDLKEEIMNGVEKQIDYIDKKFTEQNEKIIKKLKYVDKKLSKQIKDLDSKFTGITEIHTLKLDQLDNIKKDIEYLKVQPYYADSRLNLLEEQQEITNKRLTKLEVKRA